MEVCQVKAQAKFGGERSGVKGGGVMGKRVGGAFAISAPVGPNGLKVCPKG